MINKKRGIIFVLALILLIMPSLVNSIGIAPGEYVTSIKYGHSEQFKFKVANTMEYNLQAVDIEIEADEMAPYVDVYPKRIENLKPWDGHEITVTFNYPNEIIKPGTHTVKVTIYEVRSSYGMISARGAISGRINVIEAFNGKYAEAHIDGENVNVDEIVPIELKIHNYGTETINYVSGTADIYFEGDKVKTLQLKPMSNIASYKTKKTLTGFDSKGYAPGEYEIQAKIDYDGKQAEPKGDFKIGQKYVEILNHSKTIKKGGITRFEVIIESEWNKLIDHISADVNIYENGSIAQSFQTLDTKLNKWQMKEIEGYFNPDKLSLGMHDIEIFLNYEGLQTVKKGVIEIVEKPVEPKKESPSIIGGLNITLTPMTLITILLIIIIILITVMILVMTKRRGE